MLDRSVNLLLKTNFIANAPVPPCSVCGNDATDPESEHSCPECGQPLDPDFYAMHVAPQLQIQRGADR